MKKETIVGQREMHTQIELGNLWETFISQKGMTMIRFGLFAREFWNAGPETE
jgi:hypothetical protein